MKDKTVKIFVAIYVEAQAHSLYTVGTQNCGCIYSDVKDKFVIPHRSPKSPTHLRDPINCSRSWDKALRPGWYWHMCSVVPEAMPYPEWRRALPPQPPQAQKKQKTKQKKKNKNPKLLGILIVLWPRYKGREFPAWRWLHSNSSFAHLLGSAINIVPTETIMDSGKITV